MRQMEQGQYARKLMLRAVALLITVINVMFVLKLFIWKSLFTVNYTCFWNIYAKSLLTSLFQIFLEFWKGDLVLLRVGKASAAQHIAC